VIFGQGRLAGGLESGEIIAMSTNIEFFWRQFDELPGNGTIVVVAHNKEPLRWAYLPEDATREEIEDAFSSCFRWYGPAVCQATIMADGKMIDQWQFTVETFVHELV